MANEIKLKTRLLNLYEDSTASNPRFNSNSTDENIKLKKGEILFHEEMVATDKGETPVVLMKVGNGVTTNDQLDVVAARAADVYAWAKQEGLSVTVDPTSKGNVVASVSWDSDNNTLKVVKTDAVTPAELKAVTDLIGILPTTTTAKTIVEYVDKKTEGIATSGALTELSNKVAGVETAISKLDETYATDIALNAVKKTAEDATTVSEVDAQIVAKINALKEEDLWDAKDSAATAEANAKGYADQLIAEANLGQYTTEDEVKLVINKVIADASEGTTYDSLVELVNYIDNHGGEAAEMASAIDVLEGKVETVEGKPAYGITATQIENWDNEVGAKALAQSKTTSAEVKTQIEAYGYATVDQVTTAKESAIATAAEDAKTKADNAETKAKTHATDLNTAMDTRVKALEAIDHDAYKAADTALHTAISAEIDADVEALANGAVKDNADAIATLNDKVDVTKVSTAITNAKTEAINAASTDATTKANTAKSEAISVASADATSKANAAKSGAISEIKNFYKEGDGITLSDSGVIGIADSSTGFTFILDANA